MVTGTARKKGTILTRRLRLRRCELGARQGDIARRAGITIQTLSRLERGTIIKVHPDIIARLATALDTSTEYLLGQREQADRLPEE